MEKIALITDSCCDLTKDTLEKFNIAMFPIRIIYKDREYLDKVEISAEELYESLAHEIPTTSLPDFQYCENLLSQLKSEGYTHFIVVTVSSNLSGTHNAVRLMLEEQHIPHYLFDSKALGYPQGVMALEISKLISQGLSFNEVINHLDDIKKRTHGYIALDTLEYLKKGGRIGTVAATVGELLNLRPIISYNEDGILYSYAKARGKKQAVAKVKNIILSYLDKCPCRLWVLHGDAYEEGLALMKELDNHPNLLELSLQTVGPSMGIHTGPGVVGFALLEEPTK